MLYYILKFLMRLSLPVFYRRINISGIENIPKSGPVILACNHPNSFLDAIIIGTYSPRQLFFLTRSDVFNASWKRWLLGQMHMVPIYRMRDGIENLEKNQETFERCREVLANNGVILIFSEGLCIQEMKLRPLKKGTARIALDYAQNGNPLHVVAVGLNYPHPMQLRKEMFVGFAPAFNAADFATEGKDNGARAILTFNKKLEESLSAQVIQVSDRKDEPAIQMLLEIWRNSSHPQLKSMISGTTQLNSRLHDLPEATKIQNQISDYSHAIKQAGISDLVVSGKANVSWVRFILSTLILLPGIVLSIIPFLLANRITRKKVRLVEFKDSVMVAGGMVISLFFGLALIAVVATISWQMALTVALLFLVLARVSPWAYDGFFDYLSFLRNMQHIHVLRSKRDQISWWITSNLSPGSTP